MSEDQARGLSRRGFLKGTAAVVGIRPAAGEPIAAVRSRLPFSRLC
jgi:hypothetical protein